MDNIEEFSKSVRNLNGKRVHKVTKSYGIRDGYKFYLKNRPKDKKFVLTDCQYYKITREINNLLRDALSVGNDIVFPYRMGRLELRKYKAKARLYGKEVKTNYPIDWDTTVKLWYEDKEAFENKTLVKIQNKEVYKIYYNRLNTNYKNKSFYQFFPNRTLKRTLSKNIREGLVDAYAFNY